MRRHVSTVLIVAFAVLASGCVVIEDGEVGVKKSFGSIDDEPVGQGVTFQIPVARIVETWNVKLQEIKETAQVPSSEGLIVGLDSSLLFQVEPASAPQIRKTIGWNYVERIVVPYFRNGLRDVVSGYQVKDIYTESGRGEIAAQLAGFLRENLEVYDRVADLVYGHAGIKRKIPVGAEKAVSGEAEATPATPATPATQAAPKA